MKVGTSSFPRVGPANSSRRPAGGGSDTAGRAISERLSEQLKQPVVVENRVGAAGSIGADYAARQPADGYTILLGSTSELTQYPLVNRKVRYDPVRDFVPVSLVGTIPLALVVHSSLPVNSSRPSTTICGVYSRSSPNTRA